MHKPWSHSPTSSIKQAMRLFPGLLTLIHQLGIIRTCQVPWGSSWASRRFGEWGCSCRLQVREWRRWGSEPGTWTRGPIISISHDSVNGLSFRDGLDRCCFVIPCACTGTYAMPTTTYGHPFAALLAFHPPPPWQQGGKWQTPRRAFVEDEV